MNGTCYDAGSGQSYPKDNDQSRLESKMQTKKQKFAINCTPIYCEGGMADLGGLSEGLD